MVRKTALVALTVLALAGCNKLRGDAASSDGGEGPSSGGGGILSFLSGTPFEGEIALSIQDKKNNKTTNLVYEVKQPKMRLDVPPEAAAAANMGMGHGRAGGKSVWVLLDPPQKKLWAVTDDDKKAVVFDMGKVGDEMKNVRGATPSTPSAPNVPTKPPPKITKTGKTDKVAGYECEIWDIEQETQKVEICAAKGITWFDLRSLGGGPFGGHTLDPRVALMGELTDANHFPLRVVSSENGVETERMEATRIDKKKMDDARFTVPADYQVVDLAQMFQGLGGMGAPGAGGPPGFPPGMPHGGPSHPAFTPPPLPSHRAH